MNIDEYLEEVYRSVTDGNMSRAQDLLYQAYSMDHNRMELGNLLKMLTFWEKRWDRMAEFSTPYEKGDFLLSQWDRFVLWGAEKEREAPERGVQALKLMVHSKALGFYEKLQPEDDRDIRLYLDIGRCSKALGNYERAVRVLEEGARLGMENPAVLAELADTYALVDEMRGAKLFFREAFYLGPDRIVISRLESGLIRRLIEKVTESGLKGEEIPEWLPVYGVICGVFNVKREMKPIEYGKLKQSIYSLQSELQQSKGDNKLVPRLINKYFWLIDHYISTREDRKMVDEVLMNIKLLSPSIYQRYIK